MFLVIHNTFLCFLKLFSQNKALIRLENFREELLISYKIIDNQLENNGSLPKVRKKQKKQIINRLIRLILKLETKYFSDSTLN